MKKTNKQTKKQTNEMSTKERKKEKTWTRLSVIYQWMIVDRTSPCQTQFISRHVRNHRYKQMTWKLYC
jgi:hypothetical protein